MRKNRPLMEAKTFSEILKFNPNHDNRGRFARANGASSRQYRTTPTADAVAEIQSGKHNSLEKHLDADGNLTPEREALHKKIIDDLLEGKTGVENPTMTMLGGGPASGKSSVMSADTSNNPHAVTVDPDYIKSLLPGYAEMARQTEEAAGFYHEESSALAKRFYEVACSEHINVIYDGTGDGSERSVQKKIDQARKNGYAVEAKYVTIDTDEAIRRNEARYNAAKAKYDAGLSDTPPRKPNPKYVAECHAAVTDISVAMASKFDHIELWDNNGAQGSQHLIATGGSGKGFTVVPGMQADFDQFLAKSEQGVDGFITLPDGQVVPVGKG